MRYGWDLTLLKMLKYYSVEKVKVRYVCAFNLLKMIK